jgi:hypothetical protein
MRRWRSGAGERVDRVCTEGGGQGEEDGRGSRGGSQDVEVMMKGRMR